MATEVNVTRQLNCLSSWGYLAGIALLSSSPARSFLQTILLNQGYLMVYNTCQKDTPIERGKGCKRSRATTSGVASLGHTHRTERRHTQSTRRSFLTPLDSSQVQRRQHNPEQIEPRAETGDSTTTCTRSLASTHDIGWPPRPTTIENNLLVLYLY